MIEAARLIKASGLKPRRTIRVGCWAGEEQGLLGSRAYVRDHYGDRTTMKLAPEHEKFSAYYNLDNGAGAIRGIYLQGNDAVAPIFTSWMTPFANMGMSTYAMNVMRGTDNYSFDEVGLATFGFIQDPLDYGERTHHTNMDVVERVPPADTIGNSVIAASFAYNTANREEMIPRKPMPKPTPPAPAGR
jgi:Zn-dependent M28 family amino/carboxypeptidase